MLVLTVFHCCARGKGSDGTTSLRRDLGSQGPLCTSALLVHHDDVWDVPTSHGAEGHGVSTAAEI